MELLRVAVVALSLRAPAEPHGLAIEWDAPAGCPGGEELRARVTALGIDASEPGQLRGRIARDDTGAYRLALRLDTPQGTSERTIHAERCELLVESAAIVVAVALDPLATVPSVRPAIASLPLPPSTPSATAPTRTEPSAIAVAAPTPVRPRVRARARWLVGVHAIVGRGTLAIIDAGGEAVAGLAWPHARLELGVLALAPNSARYSDRADVGVDAGLAAAIVRGCGGLGPDRVQLELCGGLQVGAAFARGVGIRIPRTAAAPWVGFELGPRVVVRPRPRVGIVIGLGAVLGATRPAFGIAERTDAAYRLRAAAFRATIGIETRGP